MASGNSALNSAKSAREDEFYTQLSDVENEMRHYRKHFKGKTILCNCDDPFESNFFKYFVLNFNRLGLKKLIATCYTGSPIAGTQLSFADLGKGFVGSGRAYKAIVTEVYDATGSGGVDMLDVAELFKLGKNTIEELKGDGDFRSAESLELLDEADIVVTNPPFSLFREYITQLVNKGKKFIIIGNQNVIKYKEIFPMFIQNKVWIGYKFGDMSFRVPDYFEPRKTRYWQDETGQKWRSMGNICWFTNLDIKKRHESMILVKKYSPESYPRYVNYDAIEVSKTTDIPCDYDGLMGVPITFMCIYNPEQFEIIGSSQQLIREIDDDIRSKARYSQIGCFYLDNHDGTYRKMYDRVVIRNKHPEQPKA